MPVARISYTTSSQKHYYRTLDGDIAVLHFDYINPFDYAKNGGGLIIGAGTAYCSIGKRPYTNFQYALVIALCLLNFPLFLITTILIVVAVMFIIQFQLTAFLLGLAGAIVSILIMKFVQSFENNLFLLTFPNKNGWYLLDRDSELTPKEVENLKSYYEKMKNSKTEPQINPNDSKT